LHTTSVTAQQIPRVVFDGQAAQFYGGHEFTCGHWAPMRFAVLSGRSIPAFTRPAKCPVRIRKHGQHACERNLSELIPIGGFK
jgi:hypothetical protein